jgi:hypothetical protein
VVDIKVMKKYGLVVEHWDWKYKTDVRLWLQENFGPGGVGGPNCNKRWGEEYDYGLENLYMDEDIFVMYNLRWS